MPVGPCAAFPPSLLQRHRLTGGLGMRLCARRSMGEHSYWSSLADAVHSVNIGANSAVFLAVFDSTAPDASGHGVYVRAAARELVDRESIARLLLRRTRPH